MAYDFFEIGGIIKPSSEKIESLLGGEMLLNKKNILLFKDAYRAYNKTNKLIEEDLKEFQYFNNIELKWKKENFISSFKNNFFSLLMTSLLLKSCKKENVSDYLKVITCIRQCVTSTDNIIDNEDKGVIFIDNMNNRVVKNTLITMTSQNILEATSVKLVGDGSISREVLNTIYRIAQAESKRDGEQYLRYPSSEYVRDVIHSGIGGELLEIAMVAPNLNEPSKKLENFSKGLFEIGMALQALDDLCDIDEDIKEKKINYAAAKLIESGYKLSQLENSTYEIRDEFNSEYLDEVLTRAYKGFDYLIENGFPLKKEDVRFLLKHLFKIRGLGDLWDKAS